MKSWEKYLENEFREAYFEELTALMGGKVFPPQEEVFRAFEVCAFEKVKVVILGQDPYHGAGQANGLCFAVNEGVKLPPSLKNIFKEVESDLGVKMSGRGDLLPWAEQGVLLLNSILTVVEGKAGSHEGKGWERLTDAAIRALSREREGLVFMLWGKYAQAKGAMIDREKHLVLEAAHPSPLSAYRGFFGCKHFSQANAYLHEPIKWEF